MCIFNRYYYQLKLKDKKGEYWSIEQLTDHDASLRYANKVLKDLEHFIYDLDIKKEDVVSLDIFKEDQEGDDPDVLVRSIDMINSLSDENYYSFRIPLNSPYKWGPGYGCAKASEIAETEKILDDLKFYISFIDERCNKNDKFNLIKNVAYKNSMSKFENQVSEIIKLHKKYDDARVYYNNKDEMEEIFVHPMEIVGCAKKKTIQLIVEYFNQLASDIIEVNFLEPSNSLGAFIYRIVENYTFDEVLEKINNLEISTLREVRERDYILAMNADLGYIGFNFKDTLFATTSTNRDINTQRNFVISLINSRLMKLR